MSDDKEKIPAEEMLKAFDLTEEDLKNADEGLRVFILVQGEDWERKPYWAYMAIPPSRVPEFQTQRELDNNALFDFGDMLHFGYGMAPPPETKEMMERDFGMQHDFESQVETAVEQITERKEVIEKYTKSKHESGEDDGE